MRYRYPRRNAAPTLADELDALAARVAALEDEGEYFDRYKMIRPILNQHLGHYFGPSADWINPTWSLGGDLYLFEGDYDDYSVVSRVPADDPDEPDVIEEVEELRDLDALRRYFRARTPRRNPPRRPPPPPPPSHLFQLTAEPYQQRLFGPEAFEQRPKKRAVEPAPVDERQVDLFAPPPPPKAPRANPTCPKCGGTGKLSAFRHVEQGTCFRCGGTGKVDKLTPAEKGQAAPPPPTGSYGVRISSEHYNAILSGYSSFEEANKQRRELAEEHKDATYTVVKFDGKVWRTRSGERANPRRRR
jgi:hypothetical protein